MDNNTRPQGESVRLSSCMWLGGADCMITTLNNIVTGGGLTYFFVNHLGMSPASSALCWLLFGLWNALNDPLFGFTSPEAVGVPVTALGAAGASLSMTATLIRQELIGPCDIAVFTAMCMCWSGYLSTHTSMMDSLGCKELIGKAIGCHTLGGFCAGIAAHWIFVLLSIIG